MATESTTSERHPQAAAPRPTRARAADRAAMLFAGLVLAAWPSGASAVQGAPLAFSAAPRAVAAIVAGQTDDTRPDSAHSAGRSTTDVSSWEALWRTGHRRDAIAAMTQALAARPQDDELRADLAAAQLAVHQVEAALATAEALGPEHDRLRATALYILARYDEAIPVLDEDALDEALMLIDALEALGRLDEADAASARAGRRHGEEHVRLLCYRARRASQAGDLALAVELFTRARDLDPVDVGALYGLGRALVRSDRREEGLALLEQHRRLVPLVDAYDFARRAVDLDPSHASNHAAVAAAEHALGLLEAADEHFRLATRLAQPAELAPVVLRHARMLVDAHGDIDGAVTLLQDAWTRHPDARLMVRAGDLLMNAGRASDAVPRYERALALRPTDNQIVQRLQRAREDAAR